MKREQREVYNVLADEIDRCICVFCKFSWAECSTPCDCGEPSCHHHLGERLENQWGNSSIEPGCDCWGFRPCADVSLAADITGVVLQHGWDGRFSWWTDKEGVLKITGKTSKEMGY